MSELLKFRNARPPKAAATSESAPCVAVPRSEPPAAPAWLAPDAKAQWDDLVPLLTMGWQQVFADTLGMYCTLVAQFKKDPEGFGVARMAQLRGLAADLALTPRAQRLVHIE